MSRAVARPHLGQISRLSETARLRRGAGLAGWRSCLSGLGTNWTSMC